MISFVLGLQWGDEGKGKIVDLLGKKNDIAVRFHGGNNAGHTVVLKETRYPFHLIPSAILNKNVVGVIANGVIVDPEVLLSEVEFLEKQGFNLKKRLLVSERCHLILTYHKALDQAYENARGKNKLGTTRRGIGPTFADKVSYNGIRFYELVRWPLFVEKFTFQAKIKNKILKLFGVKSISIKKSLASYQELRKKLLPYITDTISFLKKAEDEGKNILLEGAHGVMLDVDFSPYPFSTGSNVVTGVINTGSGLSIKKIDNVLGVVKAYLSRVGAGPLPTEINNEIANQIREKGKEYGTTTGRPRRIGWLDLEAVKYAISLTGVNQLVLTKIDVLSGLKQIKIAVGYQYQGKKINLSACGYEELAKIKPIYQTFVGWQGDITRVKKFSQLPLNCQKYINFIENFLQTKIKIISVSPEREDNILL